MTEIPLPDNSRQMYPKCNSPIIHGTKFCESCGARIAVLPVGTTVVLPTKAVQNYANRVDRLF